MITSQQKKIYYSLYACLFFYLFVLQLYYAWHFTIDDAFISFRYAKHLAAGHGLSWNIGENKVEGFSNFSYVLLQALLIKLKLPVLKYIKLFSASAMLVSLYGLHLIAKTLKLSPLLTPLPALILLIHPGEIFWGMSGLETPFYQLLTIFTAYFLIKGQSPARNNKALFLSAGLTLALAGLTRPEAPILLLTFLFLSLIQIIKAKSQSHKIILVQQAMFFIFGFILLYAPYFLWRFNYFGHLFPNTVYCKFNNAPSGALELDIDYLNLTLPLCLIMLPYLLAKKSVKHAYLLLPSLTYLCALYNADWIVGYWHRHFLAVYALILPPFVAGVSYIMAHKKLSLPTKWQLPLVILFSLTGGFLFTSMRYSLEDLKAIASDTQSGNELRASVGHWLNKNVPNNQKISLGDCGLIPYISKHAIIDSYCLNNAEFNKAPINSSYKKFTQHLLTKLKPENIILLALITKKHSIYPPSDFIIQQDKLFKQNYQPIHAAYTLNQRTEHFSAYRYEVFKRKT